MKLNRRRSLALLRPIIQATATEAVRDLIFECLGLKGKEKEIMDTMIREAKDQGEDNLHVTGRRPQRGRPNIHCSLMAGIPLNVPAFAPGK